MERIIRVCGILAVLGVLAGGPRADGAIVELPLDCAGEYGPDNLRWELVFDLGAEFTEISHVYIDWSGEITGGLYSDMGPGDAVPTEVEIYAVLGSSTSLYWAEVWGGVATYPEGEPFDELTEFGGGAQASWSFLLDGSDEIRIGYQGVLGTGSYIEDGSVSLTNATLVVEGTLVPEPATIVLLGMGGMFLFKNRCRG